MLATALPPAAAADDRAIAQELRAGGLVSVVRHGSTFPDQADTDLLNFDNIATQRNLNDRGKTLAKTFGDALRQVGVPVARFTPANTTGRDRGSRRDIVKTADLTEGGLVVTPNENASRAKAFLEVIGTPPVPGTNTILITHQPNIVAALGKDWFDVKEGEASLIKRSRPPLHCFDSLPEFVRRPCPRDWQLAVIRAPPPPYPAPASRLVSHFCG